MKVTTPSRTCALCERKVKYKERLCPEHKEEYKNNLTDPWLRGIIEEHEYQWNVERRDGRLQTESGEIKRVEYGDKALAEKDLELANPGQVKHRGPGGAYFNGS